MNDIADTLLKLSKPQLSVIEEDGDVIMLGDEGTTMSIIWKH